MKIFKGTVHSKRDMNSEGWLTVLPDGATATTIDPDSSLVTGDSMDGSVQVKYVSPYGGNQYAGFVAMPEADQQILYCMAENDEDQTMYYMGSIISPTYDIDQEIMDQRTGALDPVMPHYSKDYGLNFQSMCYGIKSPLNQMLLLLTETSIVGGKPVENKRIQIESQNHHGLYLGDSTETQKVLLKSGYQAAALTLLNEPNWDPSMGPGAAHLYSKGNMVHKAWEGSLKVQVVDGQNIQILNNSTGGNSVSGNTENTTLGAAQKAASFGNIQIHTDRGDVVISSKGNGVFIDCYAGDPTETGSSFQVRSQNKIHLYAENGIDLKSSGDINIRGKNVNIEAEDKVQLNPTYSVDDLIGIRKTNVNSLQELINAPYTFHFFPPGSSLLNNYTEGRNNDSRLGV